MNTEANGSKTGADGALIDAIVLQFDSAKAKRDELKALPVGFPHRKADLRFYAKQMREMRVMAAKYGVELQ